MRLRKGWTESEFRRGNRRVTGWTHEGFGVHREDVEFHVTHLRTGCDCCFVYGRRATAMQFAEALAQVPGLVTALEGCHELSNDAKAKLSAVIDRAWKWRMDDNEIESERIAALQRRPYSARRAREWQKQIRENQHAD